MTWVLIFIVAFHDWCLKLWYSNENSKIHIVYWTHKNYKGNLNFLKLSSNILWTITRQLLILSFSIFRLRSHPGVALDIEAVFLHVFDNPVEKLKVAQKWISGNFPRLVNGGLVWIYLNFQRTGIRWENKWFPVMTVIMKIYCSFKYENVSIVGSLKQKNSKILHKVINKVY